jgi:hypothetical protein
MDVILHTGHIGCQGKQERPDLIGAFLAIEENRAGNSATHGNSNIVVEMEQNPVLQRRNLLKIKTQDSIQTVKWVCDRPFLGHRRVANAT